MGQAPRKSPGQFSGALAGHYHPAFESPMQPTCNYVWRCAPDGKSQERSADCGQHQRMSNGAGCLRTWQTSESWFGQHDEQPAMQAWPCPVLRRWQSHFNRPTAIKHVVCRLRPLHEAPHICAIHHVDLMPSRLPHKQRHRRVTFFMLSWATALATWGVATTWRNPKKTVQKKNKRLLRPTAPRGTVPNRPTMAAGRQAT